MVWIVMGKRHRSARHRAALNRIEHLECELHEMGVFRGWEKKWDFNFGYHLVPRYRTLEHV